MLTDLFVAMFTADTKNFEQGAKKVKKSTDEIKEQLSDAEKQAKAMSQTIGKFLKGALGFYASYKTASKLVTTTMAQAEKINLMSQTADSIQTTTQNLDAFTKALQESGAEASATEDALRSVFRATGQAMADSKSEQAEIFNKLGISLKNADGSARDTIEIMTELSEATEKLGKVQATNLYKKLGISDKKVLDSMIKGRKELEANIKKQKELGVVSKKQIEIAKKYSEAQTKLNHSFERAKNSIMQYLAPTITWLVDKFSAIVDWANEHKVFIIGFFSAIAVAVAKLYLPVMIKAAIATTTALAPILAIAIGIGALATAIALLVDDIWAWIDGQDNLLGGFIKQIFWCEGLSQSITKMMDDWSKAFDECKEDFIAFGNAFLEVFRNIDDFVSSVIDNIISLFTGLINDIIGGIDKLKSGYEAVKSFFGFGDDEIKEIDINKDINHNILKTATLQVQSANGNPLNNISSSTISNFSNANKNVEQNIGIGEIKIQTQAVDSKSIASNIGSDLKSQLQNLKAESQSGIDI